MTLVSLSLFLHLPRVPVVCLAREAVVDLLALLVLVVPMATLDPLALL